MSAMWKWMVLLIAAAGAWMSYRAPATQPARRLDPAAWGSDHVGKPVAPAILMAKLADLARTARRE